MNIFQLLEWLHPDLAEWERQRRLRAMRTPNEKFMDGPELNPGGVYYDRIPMSRFGNARTSQPALGHLIMPNSLGMLEPLPPINAPISKREKTT